ncbi:hypothetical protein Ancab_029016 [Ancistrocladus abbreviatus]
MPDRRVAQLIFKSPAKQSHSEPDERERERESKFNVQRSSRIKPSYVTFITHYSDIIIQDLRERERGRGRGRGREREREEESEEDEEEKSTSRPSLPLSLSLLFNLNATRTNFALGMVCLISVSLSETLPQFLSLFSFIFSPPNSLHIKKFRHFLSWRRLRLIDFLLRTQRSRKTFLGL